MCKHCDARTKIRGIMCDFKVQDDEMDKILSTWDCFDTANIKCYLCDEKLGLYDHHVVYLCDGCDKYEKSEEEERKDNIDRSPSPVLGGNREGDVLWTLFNMCKKKEEKKECKESEEDKRKKDESEEDNFGDDECEE